MNKSHTLSRRLWQTIKASLLPCSMGLSLLCMMGSISHAAVADRALNIKVGNWTLNSPAISIIAEQATLKEKRLRKCELYGDKYPFAVVIDEAETEDGQKHILRWSIDLPNTCSVYKYIFGIEKELHYTGISLYNTNSAPFVDGAPQLKDGTPMLYIVVLQNDNDASRHRDSTVARTEHYNATAERSMVAKRLVIPSYSQAPHYKLLFIPYRFNQDKLPTVLPGEGKNQTIVTWENRVATIEFITSDTKPTSVKVNIKESSKSKDHSSDKT